MKKRILCYLFAFLCIILCSCQAEKVSNLNLIEEESFFSDFVIEDGTVIFYCKISVLNETEELKLVEIHGDFTEDFESGLISKASLTADDPDTGVTSFLLSPGENQFRIAFSCEHAGRTTMKQTRLLPQIRITEIQGN